MRIRTVVVLLAFLSVALTQPEGIDTGEGLYSLLFPGNGGIELATTPGGATLSAALPKSFTFESWIMLPNPPADGNYKTICSRYDIGRTRDPHNRYADWNLQVQASGTLNFFLGNGGPSIYGIIIFGSNLVQGLWANIQFTVVQEDPNAMNPDYAQLFFNGNQWNKSWTTGTRQLLPNRSIFLGDYYNQDLDHKYWLGYMDEVRFWAGVRSPSDLAAWNQRVVPYNSPNLLAYYRFNDGAGLVLQDSTSNYFDGVLYKVSASTTSPLWRVSGVKINVDVTVAPGSITTIDLPGLSPNGAFAFTYVVQALPSSGNGTGIGRLLADGSIITTVPFGLIDNQLSFQAPTTPGVLATFSYYGTYNLQDPTQREPYNTLVFAQIGNVNCPTDECGVCYGNNSTCSCLPLPYNGYNLTDVERILLLYEIEQSLALLDDLSSKIEATLTLLTGHQVAELQTIIQEVQMFGSTCLMAFCDNIQGYLDNLAAIGPQ